MGCENTIELPYYSAGIARIDLCCYCAAEGISVNEDLKKQFKTVLPVCVQCVEQKNRTVPCLAPTENLKISGFS